MDKILLNRIEFYGFHGVFPEEKKLGQRFIIDLELETPLETAGKTDDMNDSIDYGEVYGIVKEIVEGEPKDLIEAVAETMAATLFQMFKTLEACRIKVTKPDPPIQGHYESVAVEIYRERNNE
ncbi:dihydroneopterin aldolase [Pseudogracilibacillus sp. SE30717A]|uniref:dihydroneopterin aldolase n=1 Tax=Pseudogracilibacillus sp. SE30717A TaxID=3098293 RepID=UPI00300DC27D